jgi:hypothetical protein
LPAAVAAVELLLRLKLLLMSMSMLPPPQPQPPHIPPQNAPIAKPNPKETNAAPG